MFVRFETSRNSKYIGFVLTYAPFGKINNLRERSNFNFVLIFLGEVRTIVTTEAYEPTVPTVDLKSFSVTLEIPPEDQNTATWNNFKNLIALAVNDYTTAHNLSLATAQ